jgi:hypothetical protein
MNTGSRVKASKTVKVASRMAAQGKSIAEIGMYFDNSGLGPQSYVGTIATEVIVKIVDHSIKNGLTLKEQGLLIKDALDHLAKKVKRMGY